MEKYNEQRFKDRDVCGGRSDFDGGDSISRNRLQRQW
jgi:hypothetical protein